MRSRLSKVFAVLAIALTALGAVLIAPQDAHAAWRKGNKGWWWTENSAKGYATGWRKISGKWYYFDPEDGEMETGWLKIGGETFYLDKNGVRLTGWQTIQGKQYYFNYRGVLKPNATR